MSLVISKQEHQYELMKVAQLRHQCKVRGVDAEGRKEELIQKLLQQDENGGFDSSSTQSSPGSKSLPFVCTLTPDDLRELATIADEMRHIRRQHQFMQSRQAIQTPSTQTTSTIYYSAQQGHVPPPPQRR